MRGRSHFATNAGLTVTVNTPTAEPLLQSRKSQIQPIEPLADVRERPKGDGR
ncbi:hypothetical protein QF000_000816 [Paraburkholderia atlantica]|uniref:Uncharacterized protein n=2 Tax=Paraburkholderia TaxID=1822464 RepID=A0A7W8LF99_9BURK|nr:hypothetical protein [Paraburkholderia youngii]MBB5421481.1 hypothetical protein [Paraburkholderia atlantica]MBB5429615.1 hypothetical protein [Paraburkholderia atlantica]